MEECTQENFEVNRRNHFAHAALSAVADCPLGEVYNPLHIWAEEKDQEEIDHLLQAFLNSVTDKKVRVLRMSEMCGFIVDAIRKTLEASDLSSYSSHKLASTLFDDEDIVVLKDAQYLEGEYKFSMQMEVGRIISHLVTGGKQILVLSNIPLSRIPYLKEKLRMMCPMLLEADILNDGQK